MVKVLNVVFGIGIGVVVFILMLLGVQAFYPEPRYEDYCNESMRYDEPIFGFEKCPDNITVGECRASITELEKEMQKCEQEYEQVFKAYSKNFFIIANALGIILILTAFFFRNIANISAGVACSGIVLILWGFMRGWMGTDDKVKFVVALIIAAIVIALAVIMNKKLEKD